jgi:hypothetical protein
MDGKNILWIIGRIVHACGQIHNRLRIGQNTDNQHVTRQELPKKDFVYRKQRLPNNKKCYRKVLCIKYFSGLINGKRYTRWGN